MRVAIEHRLSGIDIGRGREGGGTQRERVNSDFVKTIELAGKLGVPYIGTQSGKDASKTFEAQVDEIVRVYH